jgi:hypothetical protein
MEISPRAINAILGMLGVQIQPEQIQAVIDILQTKLPEVINDYQELSARCERIESKLDSLLVGAAAQKTDPEDIISAREFISVNGHVS